MGRGESLKKWGYFSTFTITAPPRSLLYKWTDLILLHICWICSLEWIGGSCDQTTLVSEHLFYTMQTSGTLWWLMGNSHTSLVSGPVIKHCLSLICSSRRELVIIQLTAHYRQKEWYFTHPLSIKHNSSNIPGSSKIPNQPSCFENFDKTEEPLWGKSSKSPWIGVESFVGGLISSAPHPDSSSLAFFP